MKKFLQISALAFTLLCVSCTKDVNPYTNTSWGRSVSSMGYEFLEIISFTDSQFEYYEADLNGNYKDSFAKGNYTYSGNEIYINKVRCNWPRNTHYIMGASVEGNKLILHTLEIFSSGESYEFDWVMMKR